MADTRFLNFDEAMDLLKVGEDELHDLVAANELRAFRVDREMKFKEADIKDLAVRAASSPSDSQPLSIDDVVAVDDADVVMVDVDEGGTGLEEVEFISAVDEFPMVGDEDEIEPSEPTVQVPAATGGEVSFDDDAEATVVLDDSDLEMESSDGKTEMEVEPVSGGTEPVFETPSSDGLGTEEIIFEDDDLGIGSLDDDTIGTQEVTVQEVAISENDLAMNEDTVDADHPGGGSSRRRLSGRSSARISGRSSGRASMRRTVRVQQRKGDLVWGLFLVITALTMIYPMILFVTISWQGFVTGPESFTAGYQKNDVTINEMGPTFVHKFYRSFLDYEISNTKPKLWWGQPQEPAITAEGPGGGTDSGAISTEQPDGDTSAEPAPADPGAAPSAPADPEGDASPAPAGDGDEW